MKIVFHILVFLLGLVGMEAVAWFTHKYVMHGLLWVLHEDHHRAHEGWLEKNDWFTVFFMSLAIFCIIFGLQTQRYYLFSLGLGISAYGMCYFAFHDLMFHRRLKLIKRPTRSRYLKRLIKAHTVHHSSSDKNKSICYGFLWASRRYDEK